MPGWHEAVADLVQQGNLALLGIIQEQHPDRCRLFAQWKEFDWPILHDPINLLGSRAVPIVTAIDEHGIVRNTRPDPEWVRETFLGTGYPSPADMVTYPPAKKPEITNLQQQAEQRRDQSSWLPLGDAAILWGDSSRLDLAVDSYRSAVRLLPDQATPHFRLGVAYRMRYESDSRHDDDFQRAIDAWGRALEIDPNHYIYRRRIQQYGPRLIKPYPFYDWVEQARLEITARGQKPVDLIVEPSGAEIARPSRSLDTSEDVAASPDPDGRITRDNRPLIALSAAFVPSPVEPGAAARVHLSLRPNQQAHWNNEVDPVQVWVEPPAGWTVSRRLHRLPLPGEAVTRELRRLEFEVQAPAEPVSSSAIRGYALYYVCEEVDGTCLYLRQDFEVTVPVKKP